MSLHESVRIGDHASVLSLLEAGTYNVNDLDDKKRTAMHLASWRGDDTITDMLLKHGANCRLEAMDAFTALHFAAQAGAIHCCELLLAADPSLLELKVSKGNKTALHLAISKGHIDVVRLLVEAGADVKAKVKQGMDALALATTCTNNKDAIIAILSNATTNKKLSKSATIEDPILQPAIVEPAVEPAAAVKRRVLEVNTSAVPVLMHKKKAKVEATAFLSHLADE